MKGSTLFLAKSLVSKNSFLNLKSKETSQLLSPWAILKYERISSDLVSNQIIVSATSIHPVEFRKQLEFLKSNCKVISLTELVSSLRTGKKISLDTVVITLDGGFKDNFDTAFPILKELKLPATFFVPVGLIDTKQLAWQDKVAAAISQLVDSGREFPILTSVEPEIASQLQENFKKTKNKILLARGVVAAIEVAPPSKRLKCLEEISYYIQDLRFQEIERVYMTWEEVKQCNQVGIEIGSLGLTGVPIMELTKEELAEELHMSYQVLFNVGINPSRVFALPQGLVTEDSEKFLFEMGFPFVVGENYFSPFPSNEKAQILKRISIDNSNSKPLERFICRIAQVKKPFSKENY